MEEENSRDSDDDPLSENEARKRVASPPIHRTQDPNSSDKWAVLECRISREIYVVIGIWVLTGLGFQIALLWAPRPGDFWGVTAVMVALFHLPSLFFIFWVERIRVWADEEGLRFRGLARTRLVAWSEIEDFGWELAPKGNNSRLWSATIWVRGKKKHLSRMLGNFDALREVVAAQAVNAPVREWALVGTRECDEWPRTFTYLDTPNWKIVAWFFGGVGLMMLQVEAGFLDKGWDALVANFTQTWDALGVEGRVGFIFAYGTSLLGLPTVFTALMYSGLSAKRRFLGRHVVATLDGLEFWNGPSRRKVRWDEIERFELEPVRGHLQRPLCVLYGEGRGQRFEFHSGIEQASLLRELIVQKAVNASTSEWKTRLGVDDDNLADELSLWPSGVVGIGPKRYHYRTRTNRALLLLCWTPPILSLVVPLLRGSGQWRGWGDLLANLFIIGCLTLGAVLGTRGFRGSWVEADEDGLTHHSIWHTRKLRWEQVQRATHNGYFLQIQGERVTMRVGYVVSLEHLMSDIESKSGIKIQRAKDFKADA